MSRPLDQQDNQLTGKNPTHSPAPALARSSNIANTAPVFDPALFVAYYQKNAMRPRIIASLLNNALTSTTSQKEEDWPSLSPQERHYLKDLLIKLSFAERAEGNMGHRLTSLTKDEADRESLRLYVQEEEQHGREFLWLAERLQLGFDPARPGLGGRQMTLVAQFFNFGKMVEASTLLQVGEVLTLAFYREFAKSLAHPLVEEVIGNIIRDEAGHIRYHGARVRTALYGASFGRKLLLRSLHQLGVLVTLLATVLVVRKNIQELTPLRWRQMIDLMERDYNSYFRSGNDFSFFRSNWLFKLVKMIPIR